jgi:hypothetical protein
LLTGGGSSEYCGQNDPDAPTWSFLMLHMRNNGLGAPPTASETIAEATVPVSFTLR